MRGLAICLEINMLDFFSHDPCGHRVNVEANDVAANSVRFNQGSATTYERISNNPVRKIVGAKEAFSEGLIAKLRQDQSAE